MINVLNIERMKYLKILSISLLAVLSVMCVSCVDDETDMGMGLQDPSSIFNGKVCDTITATAVTVLDDSLLTSNYSTGVIGYYYDNVFGSVKASMYTQAALSTPSTGVTFANATIDSVVVSLVCSGAYPKPSDTNAVVDLEFQVYEVTEDMYLDTSYYATDSKTYSASPYFDDMVTFRFTDTIVNLKLNSSIYSKFENKVFASNSEFLEELKGLLIRMNYNTMNNYMLYVNYWAISTGMTVYYKDESGVATKYSFLFDKTAAHFNSYEHNYSGTPLNVFQTQRTDSIEGDQKLYLEALGGTSVKFRFPYLSNWAAEHPNAVIHQAELFVYLPNETVNSNPPASLILYRYDADGSLSAIPDMLDGVLSEGFDGNYNSSNRSYRMRVSRQIQQMVSGSVPDLGMRMYVNSRRSVANRCVVSGTATDQPIKLKIIYTE